MVESIKQNFERLIALYEGEKQKNAQLASQLEEYRVAVQSGEQQITDLKRQIENLKLAGAFTGNGGSSAVAKEKIDKLIREIDKCISFLEK
ncbi:MAG: hypothetical protein IKI89_07920 [Bacteroidales bacterium]|nr:hypothetical protein [Bacteroidales bacterium]